VSRRRICFHAPYLYPVTGDDGLPFAGGAEVQQWLMARGLAALGWDVRAVTCDYGQPRRVVREGVTLIRAFRPHAGLPLVRFFHPRLSLAVRALAEADADVYFVQGVGIAAGVAFEVARLRGARFVFMGANDQDFERALPFLERPFDRWWQRRALLGADRLIAQSGRQREILRREFGLDADVVMNPVPVPERTTDAGADGVVLWLATYKALKRPAWFVELARRLPHRRFVMRGVIPVPPLGHEDWDAARRAAAALPNLEVGGFARRAELPELFARASLFVHTSPTEGFPNTVLEAWASGIPCVTTFDPGGVIASERLGETVETLDGLEASVERWMADPAARRAAGARARAYCVARHAPERVAADLAGVLQQALATPGRRPPAVRHAGSATAVSDATQTPVPPP
jgi:glycosyltransferase involved in cell wall biosynthesis